MRDSRCFPACAAIVLAMGLAVFPARRARATVAVRFSLAGLVENSVRIVEGTVLRSRSDWDRQGRKIFTHWDILTSRMYRGDAQETLTVSVLGGQVGNKIQQVSGTPVFKPGERVILFLWKDTEARLRCVGLTQGKFDVRKDARTGELRAANSTRGLVFFNPKTGKREKGPRGPIAQRYDVFTAALAEQIRLDDERRKQAQKAAQRKEAPKDPPSGDGAAGSG